MMNIKCYIGWHQWEHIGIQSLSNVSWPRSERAYNSVDKCYKCGSRRVKEILKVESITE